MRAWPPLPLPPPQAGGRWGQQQLTEDARFVWLRERNSSDWDVGELL